MELIKNNKFSIFFSTTMILIAAVSIIVDYFFYDGNNWFQRAGALIVLAGAELQYSEILNNWDNAKKREKEIPSFEEKVAEGKGIDMKGVYQDLHKTRKFALEIHGYVTDKSVKQTIAIIFIVIGTVVWGYGDLPFK
ncbi:hypothetical protein RUV71_003663 [Vibrio cholerae]|nr:hypothetical protein [Vibrio cholerae]